MKKIIITGGNGTLAGYFKKQFEKDNKVFTFGKKQLDVCKYEDIKEIFFEVKPEIVFHLAALTDVDYCQKNPDEAFSVNAEGTKNVARLCKEIGSFLVFISTASVFNGKKEVFFEDDTPDPVHIYGESKLRGEKYVEDILDEYIILRIGWLIGGGRGGKKFISYILEKIKNNEELKIVNDKFGTISYALEVTEIIQKLLQQNKRGIFHYGSSGICSRLTLAQELKKLTGSKSRLIPAKSSDFESKFSAPRPVFEVIGSKILKYPNKWQESLAEYYKNELE